MFRPFLVPPALLSTSTIYKPFALNYFDTDLSSVDLVKEDGHCFLIIAAKSSKGFDTDFTDF